MARPVVLVLFFFLSHWFALVQNVKTDGQQPFKAVPVTPFKNGQTQIHYRADSSNSGGRGRGSGRGAGGGRRLSPTNGNIRLGNTAFDPNRPLETFHLNANANIFVPGQQWASTSTGSNNNNNNWNQNTASGSTSSAQLPNDPTNVQPDNVELAVLNAHQRATQATNSLPTTTHLFEYIPREESSDEHVLMLALMWPKMFLRVQKSQLHKRQKGAIFDRDRYDIAKIEATNLWTVHDLLLDNDENLQPQKVNSFYYQNILNIFGRRNNAPNSCWTNYKLGQGTPIWEYQWRKHGCKTGFDAYDYFDLACTLWDMLRIRGWLQEADIRPHNYHREGYPMTAIQEALEKEGRLRRGCYFLECIDREFNRDNSISTEQTLLQIRVCFTVNSTPVRPQFTDCKIDQMVGGCLEEKPIRYYRKVYDDAPNANRNQSNRQEQDQDQGQGRGL